MKANFNGKEAREIIAQKTNLIPKEFSHKMSSLSQYDKRPCGRNSEFKTYRLVKKANENWVIFAKEVKY